MWRAQCARCINRPEGRRIPGEGKHTMSYDNAEFFLSEKVGQAIMAAERRGLTQREIVDAVMGEMGVRAECGAAMNVWLADAAKDEGMQGLEIPGSAIAAINSEFAADIEQAYA